MIDVNVYDIIVKCSECGKKSKGIEYIDRTCGFKEHSIIVPDKERKCNCNKYFIPTGGSI